MYCRNCGKKLDTEAEFCNECLAKFDDFGDDGEEISESKSEVEQTITDSTYSYSSPATYQSENITQTQNEGSIMAGFGLSLTGSILSAFGIMLVLFSFIFTVVAGSSEIIAANLIEQMEALYPESVFITQETYDVMIGMSWFLWVLSLGLTIPSLIFGIKSIKRFAQARREGLRKKPIPAFALGIETTAVAGFCLFYALLTLLMLLVL